ncbi:hypothetical protein HK104_001828 [Borealophlyctis nickersoniae]|nr:hypothetical protein HK104_001828 [Borealophlyctis nickersoniae]
MTSCSVNSSFFPLEFQVAANGPVFTNLATFDAHIRSNLANATAHINTFRQLYGCPTYDGSGRRFPTSFLCALYIDITVSNKWCPGSPKPLCKTTATETIDSLKAVWADAKVCPAGAPGATARVLDKNWQTMFDRLSTDENCIVGSEIDWPACGFSTDAQARAYCQSTPGDSCCVAVSAKSNRQPIVLPTSYRPASAAATAGGGNNNQAAPGSTPTPNTSSNATANTSSSSSSSNTVMIAGVSAAGVVAVVAVGVAVLYLRKRRKTGGEGGDLGEPIQIAETMEVIYNYVPNLSDEVYLYVGDPVIVKCKFDDGWAFGFNMTTKQEGSFPLACVAPYNTPRPSTPERREGGASRISARVSSLYVPNNGGGGGGGKYQSQGGYQN